MKREYFPKESGDAGKIPNMARHGYTLVKCHHMFGWAPVYKHESGKMILFHLGKFQSAAEVLADLRENWFPASQAERDWKTRQMPVYFYS